jgi:hypothetical protein
MHVLAAEVQKEQRSGTTKWCAVSAFFITAVLTVIVALQHSNHEVNTISAESTQSARVHLSQEMITTRHTRNIMEYETDRNTNNAVHVHDNVTTRLTQVYPAYEHATVRRAEASTLIMKLNSASKSSADIKDRKRVANFLMAIEALDKIPSNLSKASDALAEKSFLPRPATLLLPPANLTKRTGIDRLVNKYWLTAQAASHRPPRIDSRQAPRIDKEQRAAQLEPAAAKPMPAPNGRESTRSAAPPATSYKLEAAADRLAALQEFLRRIEELDRAP